MSPVVTLTEEDALHLIIAHGCVEQHVIQQMPEDELLRVLPLILSLPNTAPVTHALQKRIRECRALKLAVQLLCTHAAFENVRVSRRYNSRAYQGGEERVWRVDGDELRFLVDMVDLQSVDFFSNTLFTQFHHAAGAFGHHLVIHPFPGEGDVLECGAGSDNTNTDSTDDGGTQLAQTAKLRREQERGVVTLYRMRTGKEGLNVELMDVVGSEIVVREGNRMKDVAMQMLLRVLNALWAKPSRQFPDCATAPYCITTDILPVEKGAVERMVRKGIGMNGFHFEYWRYTKGLNPIVADGFVRSAAGLYAAGYVCGLWGKEADVGVAEGGGLYLRAVREVFENYGQMRFDIGGALRLVVPKEMRDAFKELGVWDEFKDTAVRAFHVIRDNWRGVFAACQPVWEKSGIKWERIEAHVKGKYSLNLADSLHADAQFRKWLDSKLW